MEFRARLRVWLIVLTAASGLLWAFSTVAFTFLDFRLARIYLFDGRLIVLPWFEPSKFRDENPKQVFGFRFDVEHFVIPDSLGLNWPFYKDELVIPLAWLWLVGLFGLGLLRLLPASPRAGACVCGYDLTGNRSGVCPECGSAVRVKA